MLPANTRLTPWPAEIPSWDSQSAEAKKFNVFPLDDRFVARAVKSDQPLPAGKMQLKMDYTQHGKAPAGGAAKLFVNGREVASGKIDRVPPVRYSATETLDVGMDLGSVVSNAYHDKAPFAFGGRIDKVSFDLK